MSVIFQHLQTRLYEPYNVGGAYITWGTTPIPSRPLPQSGSQQPLSFPLEVPNLNPSGPPLSLVESTFYLLAPHHGKYRGKGWIVRVEEVDPTTWWLLNPLSRINNLLDCTPAPIMAKIDDPSDYLINELARSYTLVDNYHEGEAEIRASKVVPLLDPLMVEVNKEDLKLLALDWDGNLAFWKHGDEHWTKINPSYLMCTDIVSYKGKFYATFVNDYDDDDTTTEIYEIDPTNPSGYTEGAKLIASFKPRSPDECFRSCKMAEFNGRLHIVNGYKWNYSMEVLVLSGDREGEEHHWETVNSYNGNVFFITNEVSFGIPTHLLGRGYDRDWICVYTDDSVSSKGYVGSSVYTSGVNELDGDDGLEPIEKLIYPRYFDSFSKCDPNGELTSFFSLPDNKYVSLFFPPHPWLDWHCLDAHKGNPPVWFTGYLTKYDCALQFDDID